MLLVNLQRKLKILNWNEGITRFVIFVGKRWRRAVLDYQVLSLAGSYPRQTTLRFTA